MLVAFCPCPFPYKRMRIKLADVDKDLCKKMSITALFTLVKTLEQAKCPGNEKIMFLTTGYIFGNCAT